MPRRDDNGSILKDVAAMPGSNGVNLPTMEEMFPARPGSSIRSSCNVFDLQTRLGPSETALLPCPFCGQNAVLQSEGVVGGIGFHNLGCNTDGCRESVNHRVLAFASSDMGAEIAAWNRRPA